MELFNIWTVAIVAIVCHYYFENKKLEKSPAKIKELEERIKNLEEKPK